MTNEAQPLGSHTLFWWLKELRFSLVLLFGELINRLSNGNTSAFVAATLLECAAIPMLLAILLEGASVAALPSNGSPALHKSHAVE